MNSQMSSPKLFPNPRFTLCYSGTMCQVNPIDLLCLTVGHRTCHWKRLLGPLRISISSKFLLRFHWWQCRMRASLVTKRDDSLPRCSESGRLLAGVCLQDVVPDAIMPWSWIAVIRSRFPLSNTCADGWCHADRITAQDGDSHDPSPRCAHWWLTAESLPRKRSSPRRIILPKVHICPWGQLILMTFPKTGQKPRLLASRHKTVGSQLQSSRRMASRDLYLHQSNVCFGPLLLPSLPRMCYPWGLTPKISISECFPGAWAMLLPLRQDPDDLFIYAFSHLDVAYLPQRDIVISRYVLLDPFGRWWEWDSNITKH